MKRILTSWLLLVVFAAIISSCKKDDNTSNNGGGTFEAIDYTFNKATRTFEPVEEVTANIVAPSGIRFVYCFLIRDGQTDSLIYVSNNSGENPKNYTLNIPIESFPALNMSKVKGVKILVKQTDNSSIQGFINMNFFDPDLPQLLEFPTDIEADLTQANEIKGNITSIYGLKQVDIYDDYQTEDTYVLVSSITDINNAKEYALNYSYNYRKAAQHIKVVATDIYNQTNEVIINMPVDMSIFKPKFVDFAAIITPNATGTTPVSGKITSVTGLKRIDIYDDYKGEYVLVGSLDNLSGVLNYNFSYDYNFRKRAENLKIIAVDIEDLQSELIIPLNITYGSVVYRDVEMNAQTTGTQTALLKDGTLIGNCELNANEEEIILVFGFQSSTLAFINPGNPGSFPANLKCNNVGWTIANPGAVHRSLFRVLIQGANTTIDNIYTALENNQIDDLSDSFFTGAGTPGSSSPRFNETAPTTSLFNFTNAKLLYMRITDPSTSIVKNALIHVKEGNVSSGTSTIKFDIYIQK